MAQWQLGHKEEARRLYEQAVAWMDEHMPQDSYAPKFRAEAEELIKLDGSSNIDEQKMIMRIWTSLDGKFSVKAVLLEVVEGQIRLRKQDDGSIILVPIANLSEVDREYVRLQTDRQRRRPWCFLRLVSLEVPQ